jgi:hypothetical protein
MVRQFVAGFYEVTKAVFLPLADGLKIFCEEKCCHVM